MRLRSHHLAIFISALLTGLPLTASSTTATVAAPGNHQLNFGPAGQTSNPLATTASTPMPTPTPHQPLLTPSAPNVSAKAFIMIDAFSGKVLAENNADQRMAPASLTKMMTSYIISSALKQGRIHLDDFVPISQSAWQTGGSKMFVKVNDRVSVRDLIQGIIVHSGNDACVAMAEFLAGSQDSFVNLMNQQAQLLGMKNTHFTDVNGLPDPNHYTTPRDMAILARALVFDFPEDYKWYSQKWFTYNGIKQPNRNRLLWRDESVDGIKTGHTDEAGFCLVASAQKNGTRLISVVMGAPTDAARADDNEKLLTYGFRFFETHKLYVANNPLTQARVYQGTSQQLSVGVNQDFYVTVPAGQYAQLKASMTLNTPLKAPINKDQIVGSIKATLNDKIVAEAPLIALQADPKGGMWRRFADWIALFVHRG